MSYRESTSRRRRHAVNRSNQHTRNRIGHHLALTAFAALLTITWPTGASAQVVEIATCQTRATFGATYKVTANIFTCGDCLIVAADRITIDLQGFEIVQNIGCFDGTAITDGGVTSNAAESNAGDGILTGAFCTVSHNAARDNDRGIAVEGVNSLVTLNTTNDNVNEGLVAQCPGTVTNNKSARNGQNYVFDGPGCFNKNNK